MKKHAWGMIVFILLMCLMLAGGLVIFINAARNPQTLPPWSMLLPLYG